MRSNQSMRIFTPKTWCTRSSRVCTLRGRNSACWLICSTTPSKDLFADRVHGDFGFLADLHAADFGFRNVDAHIDLIAFEQSGDRSVGRNQIAGTNVENFDGGLGRREDFAFAESRFVVGISDACADSTSSRRLPRCNFSQVACACR